MDWDTVTQFAVEQDEATGSVRLGNWWMALRAVHYKLHLGSNWRYLK